MKILPRICFLQKYAHYHSAGEKSGHYETLAAYAPPPAGTRSSHKMILSHQADSKSFPSVLTRHLEPISTQ